jgi:hypothetical protein
VPISASMPPVLISNFIFASNTLNKESRNNMPSVGVG